MARVRLFIDFWNLSLNIKDYNNQYRLDWSKIPQILVPEAASPDNGSYEGCCIYASVNPKPNIDVALKRFLSDTLNRMPGYHVKIFKRKPKSPPTCNTCHNSITDCPHCQNPLDRTVEKGVDAAIVTDMLQHAWDNNYDLGVLISDDADFVPAVQFLNSRGKRIVHAGFNNSGRNLANNCWKHIDMRNFAQQLSR
ncbi:MAG: NYN domain-containing protein [Desulfobacteraceae bacterium]|jgi:uncharacterized LabA/DUF88 family protein